MSTINKDMIITLDNKESYFVGATTFHNNNKYGLIINVNKEKDYMVVKILNDNISKVEDEEELSNLYPLLNKDLI